MLLLDAGICSPNDEITMGEQFGERMEVGMGGIPVCPDQANKQQIQSRIGTVRLIACIALHWKLAPESQSLGQAFNYQIIKVQSFLVTHVTPPSALLSRLLRFHFPLIELPRCRGQLPHCG